MLILSLSPFSVAAPTHCYTWWFLHHSPWHCWRCYGCSSPRGCCDVELRMFSEISAGSILLIQPLSGFPFLVWPLSWCAYPSMIVCNHTFQLFESRSAKLFILPGTHQDPLSLQEPFTCPQIPSFPLSRFILEDPSHSRVSCDAYKLSREKQKMIPVSTSLFPCLL